MLTAALALETLSARIAAEVARGVGQGAEGLPDAQQALAQYWQEVAAGLPPLPMGPGQGVDNLYLVTEIYPAGGHRQLLEQMIRSRPHQRHLVVFTGALQIRARFSQSRLRAVGAEVTAPDPRDILWDKWLWLRQTLAQTAPQRVILAHHSEDILAALIAQEIAGAFGPRLLFLRHADTVGTLGADLAAATHLAIRPEQAEVLRRAAPERRVELLPLCYDPAVELPQLCAEDPPVLGRLGLAMPRRTRLKRRGWQGLREAVWAGRRLKHQICHLLAPYIPQGAHPLVTASCGTEHKFTREGPLALPEVIAAVLMATGGRHVHIGPASGALVGAVRAALRTKGISQRRMIFTQEVPSVADALRWHRVGLYLGSFPVSGALSRAEAAYAGIPIAARDPGTATPSARYLSGTDLRPADALIWHGIPDLADQLRGGLPDALRHRLSRSARDWYHTQHSPERFGVAWQDILGRLPEIAAPRAPLMAPACAAAPDFATVPPRLEHHHDRLLHPDDAAADRKMLWPPHALRLLRPRVFAAEHIAPVSLETDLPAIFAQDWPVATVIGGADGFLTANGLWKDDSLDGFAPQEMALRNPGAVIGCTDQAVTLRYRAPVAHLSAAIFGCGAYSHNYFHFLLEILPRIAAAAGRAPAQTPIVTERDLPQQHYQALRLLFPDHPLYCIGRGAAVQVTHLYESGMGTRVLDPVEPRAIDSPGILRYHPAHLRQLAQLRAAALPGSGPERLLLHRRAKVRRLVNFPQIRQLLSSRDFQIADTADLDFIAQIRLMAQAKTIVAQSGAHLANMLFAPPGCQIFALFSDAPGTNFRLWSALGDSLGHEVINLVGPRTGRRQPGGIAAAHAHFTVPPGYLEAFFPAVSEPVPADLPAVLTALHGMAARADVLTGAWALRAEPTPPDFTR
ncbi:glycosyltransferase 61 family protein, partial [Phaeovulum sp. W22_SRMD_FR3]|uniref:glycosyltransferase family 61 protein n=1 Tax=Phaeovulum sp. W22_SRMD_FR3 TaxID=3240274 RepID=UPI003F9918ED